MKERRKKMRVRTRTNSSIGKYPQVPRGGELDQESGPDSIEFTIYGVGDENYKTTVDQT
ncbi:hypothetical protein RUM43_013545 [Polyplax serrata]|uniref:Uncharacterized protein n=1 Tax=Polyplax serrata TaxID=468196 RepID=A0AAN8S6D8_POLSC